METITVKAQILADTFDDRFDTWVADAEGVLHFVTDVYTQTDENGLRWVAAVLGDQEGDLEELRWPYDQTVTVGYENAQQDLAGEADRAEFLGDENDDPQVDDYPVSGEDES